LLSSDAFFGLECHRNALAAGALPQTMLGALTAPQKRGGEEEEQKGRERKERECNATQ